MVLQVISLELRDQFTMAACLQGTYMIQELARCLGLTTAALHRQKARFGLVLEIGMQSVFEGLGYVDTTLLRARFWWEHIVSAS